MTARPAPGRRGVSPLLLAAILTCFLLILPLLYIALRSWQAGVAGVWAEIGRDRTLDLLRNTLLIAVAVTIVDCAIGIAVAWTVERSDLPWRNGWRVVCALPLAVPAFVSSYAWSSLGDAFQGIFGAILILTLATYPLVYLPVAAALRGIDPSLEDVSRCLGRGPWRTFGAIVLPQLRPALGAGALLVFTHMLAEFGAFSLLRVQTFTTSIFESYELQFDSATAAVQSAVLMALCLPAAYGESRLRSRLHVSRSGHGTAPQRRPIALGRATLPATTLFAGLSLLSLGAPLAVVLYWFGTGASRGRGISEIWPAIEGSIGLALPGAAFATLLALPLTLISTRRRDRFALLLDRLPYIVHGVPGLVVALSLVFLSIHYFRPLYQSAALVWVAYAILFLPLAQSALRASAELAPAQIESVARSLGRGPFGAFATTTLPLIAPGVGAALALMTLELMRELSATLLLAPTGVTTLAIEVWSHTNDTEYAAAAPFALLLVALSSVPVYVFTRRSLAVCDL